MIRAPFWAMQTVIFAFQLIINDRSRQHASDKHIQAGHAPQRNNTRRTQNAINRDDGQLAEGERVPTCVGRNRDSRKFEVFESCEGVGIL